MLKLKLQYFGHLMWRMDSLEKTLMLGKIKGGGEGDDRGWDGWMASPMRWTWVWVGSGIWWWTGKLGVLQSMGLQRVRHNWVAELNWKLGSLTSLSLVVFPGQLKKQSVAVTQTAEKCHWYQKWVIYKNYLAQCRWEYKDKHSHYLKLEIKC